jgi:hypothetical protein
MKNEDMTVAALQHYSNQRQYIVKELMAKIGQRGMKHKTKIVPPSRSLEYFYASASSALDHVLPNRLKYCSPFSALDFLSCSFWTTACSLTLIAVTVSAIALYVLHQPA